MKNNKLIQAIKDRDTLRKFCRIEWVEKEAKELAQKELDKLELYIDNYTQR